MAEDDVKVGCPDIVTRLCSGAGDAALCEEAAAEIERPEGMTKQ